MNKDFASNSLSQGSIEQDYLASNVKKSKFLLCLIKISISVLISWKTNNLRLVVGPVTKLKSLSDVNSILLGAVENDSQLVIETESYEIPSDL